MMRTREEESAESGRDELNEIHLYLQRTGPIFGSYDTDPLRLARYWSICRTYCRLQCAIDTHGGRILQVSEEYNTQASYTAPVPDSDHR